MKNNLIIAVDNGASGIKVVGSVNGEPCVGVIIDPHCMLIDSKSFARDVNFDQYSLRVKFGDEAYALGKLAETQGATLRMKPAKFTTAVPKILGAIGVFIQLLKLPGKFDLTLACVLPPGEYEDAEVVGERLESAIENLEFPSGKVKINLKDLQIHPEGFGLLQGQNIDPKDYDSILSIMMGHRNVSVFEAKRGGLCRPHTSAFGFHDLLKAIASRSNYAEAQLLLPVNSFKGFDILQCQAKIKRLEAEILDEVTERKEESEKKKAILDIKLEELKNNKLTASYSWRYDDEEKALQGEIVA